MSKNKSKVPEYFQGQLDIVDELKHHLKNSRTIQDVHFVLDSMKGSIDRQIARHMSAK